MITFFTHILERVEKKLSTHQSCIIVSMYFSLWPMQFRNRSYLFMVSMTRYDKMINKLVLSYLFNDNSMRNLVNPLDFPAIF